MTGPSPMAISKTKELAVPSPSTAARRSHRLDRRIGLMMAVEAVSFGVAALLHLVPSIAWYPQAGIPEALIGVVLAYGSALVLTAPTRARPTALVTTGFAVFGVLVGLAVTAGGGEVANLAYHASILVALLITVVLLLRPRNAGRTERKEGLR